MLSRCISAFDSRGNWRLSLEKSYFPSLSEELCTSFFLSCHESCIWAVSIRVRDGDENRGVSPLAKFTITGSSIQNFWQKRIFRFLCYTFHRDHRVLLSFHSSSCIIFSVSFYLFVRDRTRSSSSLHQELHKRFNHRKIVYYNSFDVLSWPAVISSGLYSENHCCHKLITDWNDDHILNKMIEMKD